MGSPSSTSPNPPAKSFSIICSVIVIFIGFLALIGWQTERDVLTTFIPGKYKMNPTTAITFILAGISLIALSIGREKKFMRYFIQTCAGAVLTIGTVKLCYYLFGWDFGIDRILFREKLGTNEIALNSAVSFFLAGFSLLLVNSSRYPILAQLLALSVSIISLYGILAYFCNVEFFFRNYINMSLPTAVCFFMLSAGLLQGHFYKKTLLSGIFNRLSDLVFNKGKWGQLIQSILFLVIVLPVVILAAFSYIKSNQDLTEAALSRRELTVNLSSLILKEKFDHLVDLGVSLATRPSVIQAIAGGQWEEAINRLFPVITDFPFIDRVFLTDPKGTQMAGIPERKEVIGKNFADRDWYQGVSRNWQPYVSENYTRAAQPQINVVAVAIPIKSEDAQRITGILVMQLQSSKFFQWTKEIDTDPSTWIYFVDKKGHHVAGHPKFTSENEITDFSKVPVVQKVLKGERGVGIFYNPFDQEDRVGAYSPILNYGWGVILSQSKSSAFASRDQTLRFIVFVYSFIFLMNCLLAYMIIRIVNERNKLEKKFRNLLESTPEAIVIVDSHGKIELVNIQAERIFGYQREELYGKPIEILIPERVRTSHPRYRDAFFTDPQARPMGAGRDLFGLRKDGTEIPIEIGLSPIETSEGSLALASIIDITERKRTEGQIKKLNEDLKMNIVRLDAVNKELEAFSYSVSHDLRAPLRAIDGFSRILIEDYENHLDSEGKRLLDVIRTNTHQMGTLIDSLLSFSRLSRKEMTVLPVDLNEMARAVIDELTNDNPRSNTEFQLQDLPAAYGDPLMLRQVMVNLIGNAIKFSSHQPHPVVEIGCHDENSENVYYIKDNGAGFDMQYASKLFGVFQRLHAEKEFPGTGVGLAIVQRVIQKHGGWVWAEAQVNKGATFSFTLPKQEGGNDNYGTS